MKFHSILPISFEKGLIFLFQWSYLNTTVKIYCYIFMRALNNREAFTTDNFMETENYFERVFQIEK